MKKFYLSIVALLFITTSFSQSTEVGITEGQLSVSLTGGATYAIPIAVPPGLNGVVPQISLVYNSQSGNGLAGYGWNISGVSTISRIPSTKFHDNEIDAVDFDASDRFALDGQRLVLKNTTQTYGAAGTIYETESFSNLKITAVGGSNNSPASFTVEYPDGSIASYASTSLTDWAIIYWQNAQGVRITYTYASSNNVLRITKITYGATYATAGMNEINFGYVPRVRPEHYFVGGQSFLQDQLLNNIKVKGNAIGFRNYYLFHDQTSLNYQRLTRVEEKTGDDTLAYNPLVFGYESTSNTSLFDASSAVTTNWSEINSLTTGNLSGDFDGDGKTDLIIYPKGTTNPYGSLNLFKDIVGGTTNNSISINSGVFKNVFASTFLTTNNKVAQSQGILVVKNNTSGGLDFNTYGYDPSFGTFPMQTSKAVNFPTTAVMNGCISGNVGNCNTGCGQSYGPSYSPPKKFFSGDFNGDGITDVIAIEDGGVNQVPCKCCYPGNGDGCVTYSCYSNWGNYQATNGVYLVNLRQDAPTTLLGIGNISSAFYLNARVEILDFNGDGKSDILHQLNGIVRVFSLNSTNTQLVQIVDYSEVGIKTDKPLLIGDYNGDGKMDFCIPQSNNQDSWNYYFSNGKDNYIGKNTAIGMIFYENMLPCNYNNNFTEIYYISSDCNTDGKADIVSIANSTTLDFSGGNYCQPYYSGTMPIFTTFQMAETLIANPNTILCSVTGNIGTNHGMKRYPIIAYLDHNNPQNKGEISLFQGSIIKTFKQPKDSSKDNRLKTITNGNGVLETLTFSPLKTTPCSFNCHPTYLASPSVSNYPFSDIVIAPSFQVVSQIEKQSDTYYKKQRYKYFGAVTNYEGLGFQGFRSRLVTNWHDSTFPIQSSISKYDINLRGANYENYSVDYFASPNNDPSPTSYISLSKNTYNTDASNVFEPPLQANKVYKLKNTKTEQFNGLEGTSSIATTLYNTYNNPSTATSTIKNGTNIEQITSTTIGYNDVLTSSPYIIGRPISKTQNLQIYPNQADSDTTITEELYEYNPAQLLSKVEKRSTNSGLISNWITENNTYDPYGNITKKIIAPFGETARETNYQYSATYGYRFMTKSIDVELLETDFTYDSSKGLVLTEKLPSISASFPLITTYTYDKWGKKKTVIDYLIQTKTFTFTNTSGITTIASTATDLSASSEIFDKLGRKTQSSIKNINNVSNLNTLQTYQYDMYDRAFKTSDPYFAGETLLQNETKYDTYGRVFQTIDSKGKITNIIYSGLTTTASDGTKTKISVKNALGNVISMTDSPIGGEVTYKYFANGNLKQTLYEGYATNITQDAWGRKKTLDDPSAGLYSYDYNGFGETLNETTPKGFTDYTYTPATGKLATKWVKDAVTPTNTNIKSVYEYNTTTTNKLLKKITVTNLYDGNSEYLYGYDNYKRLNSTTETFLGTIPRSFVKTVTFDGFGRVLTETNTVNTHNKSSVKTTSNTYRYGYLYQIYDGTTATGTPLWQQNTENARGQITAAALGNGVGITNTYNAYGYSVSMMHMITATATNIMTLNTDFHQTRGNLLSRSNNMFSWTESFGYDDQDRLTNWYNALGTTTYQSYEESGKIDTNSLGVYNYSKVNATPARPYQNTSVTLSTEGLTHYGSIGNQTITYNAFKGPIQITDGNKKITFGYNAMQDRSIMYYGDSNVTPSSRPYRKYYSGDGSMEVRYTKAMPAVGSTPAVLEKVEFFTYIGGDAYSAPLVARKVDAGTFENFYLHRDYQGSILAITNQQGIKVEERLFDAWGLLLKLKVNGVLSALPTAGVGLLLDRGYTGHDHLWTVALVHMNARLYDAKLHRFLQPDNFVQDPSSTQSFNRYAYCMNNPLMYTDTNGEFWHIVFGAVVGGVVNWGINGFRFDAAGAGYFGVGAASGALFATGNVFGGTALLSGGNSVVTQLDGKGKIDPGKLIGDTVTGIAISYATMGLFKGVGKVFTNVPRPPISAISTLEPAGLAGVQGATLAAETTIATQATSTSIANTASSAAINAPKELAKAGLNSIEGEFTLSGMNKLASVTVNSKIWSTTKTLSAVGNAFSHFKKHASEFPEFNNALQYVNGAKYFMNNHIDGQLTKLRPNGDFLKYHPQTNTFGITNSLGEVKTMFRPIEGMEYWLSLK